MSLLETARVNELAKLSRKLSELHHVKQKLNIEGLEKYSLGIPGTTEKTSLYLTQATLQALNVDLACAIDDLKHKIKVLAGDVCNV